MNCENCEEQPAKYELAGSKCCEKCWFEKFCEKCWFEYWQDNEIGIHTYFEDFKQFDLRDMKMKEKDLEENKEWKN